MAVLLAGLLRTVSDQEAGVAGELVLGLANDLNNELFGNALTAGRQAI